MEARTHKGNDWRKTVTLPKNLQEKRDLFINSRYGNDLWPKNGELYRIVSKESWNDCANLLLPEIKKMVEALELIIKSHDENLRLGGEGILNYELIRPARLTLQSLREFMGEESEGE